MRLRFAFGVALVMLTTTLAMAPGVAAGNTKNFGYEVPVQPTSPWPEMRHDSATPGPARSAARYRGERPGRSRPARGSSRRRCIGGDGTVYIGSADGNFYALRPDGKRALALPDRRDHRRRRGARRLDRGQARASRSRSAPATSASTSCAARPGKLPRQQRIALAFAPTSPPATGQLVNWWEGNVAYGPGRRPLRRQHRRRRLRAQPRRDPALGRPSAATRCGRRPPSAGPSGNSYWGSVDLYAFSLDPNGQQRWQTFTPGYVTSSPALGSRRHRLRRLLRRQAPRARPGHRGRALVRSRPPTTSTARRRWPATRRARRRRSTSARPTARSTRSARRAAALALRHRRPDPLLAGARPGAPRRRARSSTSAPPTASSTRSTPRPAARRWSFDTTPRDAGSARPQRPQRLARARQARRLHRRRARAGVVRPLRLLPARTPTGAAIPAPGRSFGSDIDRMFFVTPGGTTVRRPAGADDPGGHRARHPADSAQGGCHRGCGARPARGFRGDRQRQAAVHLRDSAVG